ncbi:MAG: GntR family transcriptional regulator [Anaerotruncus colihominis]
MNEANIKDINDVRFAIEPFAVMRAVENCTPRDLMQLHAIQARSIVAAEQKDAPILALCDEQFHTYIFECAKNPLLLDINKRVVAQLAVFRSKTFTIPDNVQNFIPAHAAVLEAFEKRDPELGKFMMERHLKTGRRLEPAKISPNPLMHADNMPGWVPDEKSGAGENTS